MTRSLAAEQRDEHFVDQAQTALANGADLRLAVGEADTTVDRETASLILALLQARLAGHAVMVEPLPDELTTGQAADILGVSRPTVVALIDRGELPARKLGTHRRIRTEDVLAFRAASTHARASALDELAQLSVEAG